MVAADRSGMTVSAVLPAVDADALREAIEPVVDESIVPVSDGRRACPPWPGAMGVRHEALNLSRGERVRNAFHIQTVNSRHGQLKGSLRRCHWIATKYLYNCPRWFQQVELDNASPRTCLANAIDRSCIRFVNWAFGNVWALSLPTHGITLGPRRVLPNSCRGQIPVALTTSEGAGSVWTVVQLPGTHLYTQVLGNQAALTVMAVPLLTPCRLARHECLGAHIPESQFPSRIGIGDEIHRAQNRLGQVLRRGRRPVRMTQREGFLDLRP